MTQIDHIPTFHAFAAQYLDSIRVTNKSARDDAQRYRQWIKPVVPDVPLDQITARHCAQVFNNISTQRAAGTANRVRALLRRMLNVACEEGWLTQSPAQHMKRAKEPAPRDIVIAQRDFDALLHHSRMLDNWPLGALFSLCLLTGRRVGELRALKWRDVDLDNRVLTFPDTKAGKRQQIVMSDTVFDVVNSLPRTCQPMHGPDCNCDYVMPGTKRGQEVRRYDYTWQRVCHSAGVEPFVLHGTRHHVATQLMARSSLSDSAIAMLLGHQSINTTRRYMHFRPDVMRDAAEHASSVLMAAE